MFIGVDGGGTGCRARIEDTDGRLLGAGSAGPAAVRLGIDRSLAEVEAASRAAAVDAGLPPSTLAEMDAGVGLAGIGRRGVIDEIYARSHPFRSVVYVNDATIACIGAHGGRDGGIVIIGTGSAGFALVRGREIKVGGYGFPISDEGSGADLGLRAIRQALRAHDGRMEPTRLTADVMERFDGDAFAVVAWMDRASATDYATLAPLVMRHANAGDRVGRRIVRTAAAHVDAMVRHLVESGATRIALGGGLASSMEPWLAADVRRRLSPVEGDGVSGGLILARRQRPSAVRRIG
ncbi:MAG: N-acetylglucosamine kinase [Bradyrhizobiaceae bacterium]|nr:N-acetylglucosamine kinase [Bradyrhizobiaceae bacterium]